MHFGNRLYNKIFSAVFTRQKYADPHQFSHALVSPSMGGQRMLTVEQGSPAEYNTRLSWIYQTPIVVTYKSCTFSSS